MFRSYIKGSIWFFVSFKVLLADLLQNWRLQPRMEALVRLRYARILFEETDNNLEAETALSKGVRKRHYPDIYPLSY